MKKNCIRCKKLHQVWKIIPGVKFWTWTLTGSTKYVLHNRVKEVFSKILTPLETTGGNLFSLEGFKKFFLQFKTLRRVIYIPLEWFRHLSRGFIIPLEGFRYPSNGFMIPLEGFKYPSYWFIIPLEGFRNPYKSL